MQVRRFLMPSKLINYFILFKLFCKGSSTVWTQEPFNPLLFHVYPIQLSRFHSTQTDSVFHEPSFMLLTKSMLWFHQFCGVLSRANSEGMENSQDQPLPPGVPSWPNYAHAVPSPQYPFPPNASDNLQHEINPSNSNLTVNTRVDDATVTVSNSIASNYYGAQFNGSRDIDIAAQDAVLREQVCCYLLCKVLYWYFGFFCDFLRLWRNVGAVVVLLILWTVF